MTRHDLIWRRHATGPLVDFRKRLVVPVGCPISGPAPLTSNVFPSLFCGVAWYISGSLVFCLQSGCHISATYSLPTLLSLPSL